MEESIPHCDGLIPTYNQNFLAERIYLSKTIMT